MLIPRKVVTSAKEIYEYAVSHGGNNQDATLHKLLDELEKLVQLEKYYGLSKKTVINKIEMYVEK